jgi:hypothetical protein
LAAAFAEAGCRACLVLSRRGPLDPEVAKRQELKILIYDIERMKGSAPVEFWSLSDFKNRRIHADDVTAWPRTICIAWRFLGDTETQFASEWDDGQRGMHKRIWEAFDTADITVGHNSKAFDEKHLNTGWRDLGMKPPSPTKPIDTLSAARSRFGDESKTLDALCQRIGLQARPTATTSRWHALHVPATRLHRRRSGPTTSATSTPPRRCT